MNECITCGRRVILRAMNVSVNRKRATSHWLENSDSNSDCLCLKGWHWTKWRADKAKPSITEQKIAEWNAANPVRAS